MTAEPTSTSTAASGSFVTTLSKAPGMSTTLWIRSPSRLCMAGRSTLGHLALPVAVASLKATERRRGRMTEDASLDDFLDTGSGASEDAAGAAEDAADAEDEESSAADAEEPSTADAEEVADADPTEASDAEGAPNDEADGSATEDSPASGADVDPASAVSSVSPEGVACESCGATVVRRWADGGATVCAECKEW